MRWWRWLCRMLGVRRSVYVYSEELRADERRRKTEQGAVLHRSLRCPSEHRAGAGLRSDGDGNVMTSRPMQERFSPHRAPAGDHS
jgi:hypothetical protein